MALSNGVVGWSAQCVIVVFPDHTYLLPNVIKDIFNRNNEMPGRSCFGISFGFPEIN